jgi:type II secretion system protein H
MRARGFTLIELMVVIAVIGLAGQLVFMNLGALVPSTVLTSEATRLMGDIEFIRSEARLQGKQYKIEIDLELDRWRLVLPPEERLVSEQTIEEDFPLEWKYLDDAIEFSGHVVVGNATQRSGRAAVLIDENGFTADQSIFLRLKHEESHDMVWTIQLHGLERKARLVTREDGSEPELETAEEFNFK